MAFQGAVTSDKLACHANARDSCELNITSENDNQTQTKNNKIGDISFRADINYRTKGDARLSSPILHINKNTHTDTVYKALFLCTAWHQKLCIYNNMLMAI